MEMLYTVCWFHIWKLVHLCSFTEKTSLMEFHDKNFYVVWRFNLAWWWWLECSEAEASPGYDENDPKWPGVIDEAPNDAAEAANDE